MAIGDHRGGEKRISLQCGSFLGLLSLLGYTGSETQNVTTSKGPGRYSKTRAPEDHTKVRILQKRMISSSRPIWGLRASM